MIMLSQVRCRPCKAWWRGGEPCRWGRIGIGAGQRMGDHPERVPGTEVLIAQQISIRLHGAGRDTSVAEACGQGMCFPLAGTALKAPIEQARMLPTPQAIGQAWIASPFRLCQDLTQRRPLGVG